MTTRADYAARVPDAAKRLEAKRLYDATGVAQAEQDACDDPMTSDKYVALMEEARAAFRKRKEEIEEMAAADTSFGDIDKKKAALSAANKAWQDFDSGALLTDDDGEVRHCALSGLPIFEDEPVVVDDTTGEIVLKACLGVPLDDDNEGAFVLPDDAPSQAKAAA